MDKIQQIFNGKWAIEAKDYYQLLSLILPSINAGNLTAIEQHLSKNKVTAYATMPYVADRWELEDASLPEDSVVIFTCDGVLYSWETYRLEQFIAKALSNPKIAGIVLFINGPGGMITRVDLLERMIRESSKPIAAYITGVCASAHFWFASACGRKFVSSPMDEIGSCGIIYTYQSFKKYYAELGIELKDIYPDSADLKNKMIREMEEKQDDSLIKENLSFYHNIFAQTVARNLNIEFNPTDPLFRGQTYFADVALANNYVDSYGTLEDAIVWVLSQAALKRANEII